MKAIFNLNLEKIVDLAEKSFTDINKSVTAANLVYAMLNNAMKAVVGKVVFTDSFTTIDNAFSNDSLEKAAKNLISGISTRKAQLLPVLVYVFSAIDADSAFNVTIGNDGSVKVTYGTKTLVSGTDYTVSYAVNETGKSSKVTVSGKGNYGGKVTSVSVCKNHKYGSWATTKAATCKATGTQQRVCSLCKKTETKTVAKLTTHTYNDVIVKATPSKDGTVTPTCKVCGAKKTATKISRPAKITLEKTKYTYTGKDIKPKVTVTDAKGNKIAASNYTVKYSNNKSVGVATVTITFKGSKYSGTMKTTFQIAPKGTKLSEVKAGSKSFTAKWSKQSSQTTGYEIQYSTSKKFTTKTTKTVAITKNSTTSKQVKKLKSGTTYYVRVRTYKTVKVDGKSKKIYSSWSSAKSVKVN